MQNNIWGKFALFNSSGSRSWFIAQPSEERSESSSKSQISSTNEAHRIKRSSENGHQIIGCYSVTDLFRDSNLPTILSSLQILAAARGQRITARNMTKHTWLCIDDGKVFWLKGKTGWQGLQHHQEWSNCVDKKKLPLARKGRHSWINQA